MSIFKRRLMGKMVKRGMTFFFFFFFWWGVQFFTKKIISRGNCLIRGRGLDSLQIWGGRASQKRGGWYPNAAHYDIIIIMAGIENGSSEFGGVITSGCDWEKIKKMEVNRSWKMKFLRSTWSLVNTL